MQWGEHADGEVDQGEEEARPERQKGGVGEYILGEMRSQVWRVTGNGTSKRKSECFRQRKPHGQDLEVRSSVALDKNLLFEIRQVPSWEGLQRALEPSVELWETVQPAPNGVTVLSPHQQTKTELQFQPISGL